MAIHGSEIKELADNDHSVYLSGGDNLFPR